MFSRTRISEVVLTLGVLIAASVTCLAQQSQTKEPSQPRSPGAQQRGLGPRGGRHGVRRGRAGNFGPRLLGQLNLTDDQKKQIRGSMRQTFDSNKGAREELRQLGEKRRQATLSTADQERAQALRRQIRSSMADTQTRIAGVLTAEQKAKAQELINERKANRERFGMRGRRGPEQTPPQKPTNP